jgi:hypothetical protein
MQKSEQTILSAYAHEMINAQREAALREIDKAKSESILNIRSMQFELKDKESELENNKQVALKEVVQESVDRTLKIVTETRNWMIGVLGVAAAVGIASFFLTSSRFENQLRRNFEEKVNGWLSYSMTDSPVKQTLGQIKTRALVDSMMIRLGRDSANRRPQYEQLSAENRKILLDILMNKNSPDDLFLDALKLLKGLRPRFMIYPQRDAAETYEKIFADKSMESTRKLQILETQYQDPALYSISEDILKGDYPLVFKAPSFKNFSEFKPERAAEYAQQQLESIKNFPLRENREHYSHLLEFLATRDPANPQIKRSIDTMKTSQAAEWHTEIANISLMVLARAFDKKQDSTIDYATRLLSHELSSGVSLEATSFGDDRPQIVFSYTTKEATTYASYPRQYLSILMENPSVLTKVIAHAKGEESVLKMIRAFQISQAGIPLANVVTVLGADTRIVTTGGKELNANTVNGPVWIKYDRGENNFSVDWQGKNGLFFSDKIKETSRLASASFSYAKFREFYSLLIDE